MSFKEVYQNMVWYDGLTSEDVLDMVLLVTSRYKLTWLCKYLGISTRTWYGYTGNEQVKIPYVTFIKIMNLED